jgi:hypothetical protein
MAGELEALKQIERNTGAMASAIASGRNATSMYGGGEGDKLGTASESKKLIQIWRELGKVNEKLKKSTEDARKAVIRDLHGLGKSFKDGEKNNVDFRKSWGANNKQIEAITGKLRQLGYSQDSITSILKNSQGDYKQFNKSLGNFRTGLLNSTIAVSEYNDILHEEAENLHGQAGQSIAKAIMSAAAIAAQILNRKMESLVAGGQAGFKSGGVLDQLKLGVDAARAGASEPEMMQFMAGNRRMLGALIREDPSKDINDAANKTRSAMISSSDGMESAADIVESMRKKFQLYGPQGIQAASDTLSTLGKLGARATQTNIDGFIDGIDKVAANSNMSATEVLSSFRDLAGMEGIQGMAYALGNGADKATMLTDQMLALAGSIGLSGEEFIKYQNYLAGVRKQSVVERVVAAAYSQKFLDKLDVLTEEQKALVMKSIKTPYAITDEGELKRLGEAITTQTTAYAARIVKLQEQQAGGDMSAVNEQKALEILSSGAGLSGNFGHLNDVMSGAADSVMESTAARSKNTEQVDMATAASAEFLSGLRGVKESILGDSLITAKTFATGMLSAFGTGLLASVISKGIGLSGGLLGGIGSVMGGLGGMLAGLSGATLATLAGPVALASIGAIGATAIAGLAAGALVGIGLNNLYEWFYDETPGESLFKAMQNYRIGEGDEKGELVDARTSENLSDEPVLRQLIRERGAEATSMELAERGFDFSNQQNVQAELDKYVAKAQGFTLADDAANAIATQGGMEQFVAQLRSSDTELAKVMEHQIREAELKYTQTSEEIEADKQAEIDRLEAQLAEQRRIADGIDTLVGQGKLLPVAAENVLSGTFGSGSSTLPPIIYGR